MVGLGCSLRCCAEDDHALLALATVKAPCISNRGPVPTVKSGPVAHFYFWQFVIPTGELRKAFSPVERKAAWISCPKTHLPAANFNACQRLNHLRSCNDSPEYQEYCLTFQQNFNRRKGRQDRLRGTCCGAKIHARLRSSEFLFGPADSILVKRPDSTPQLALPVRTCPGYRHPLWNLSNDDSNVKMSPQSVQVQDRSISLLKLLRNRRW